MHKISNKARSTIDPTDSRTLGRLDDLLQARVFQIGTLDHLVRNRDILGVVLVVVDLERALRDVGLQGRVVICCGGWVGSIIGYSISFNPIRVNTLCCESVEAPTHRSRLVGRARFLVRLSIGSKQMLTTINHHTHADNTTNSIHHNIDWQPDMDVLQIVLEWDERIFVPALDRTPRSTNHYNQQSEFPTYRAGGAGPRPCGSWRSRPGSWARRPGASRP